MTAVVKVIYRHLTSCMLSCVFYFILIFNLQNCWETQVGQEVYRLVVIDFLFSIIFATFCAEFLRR